MLEIQTPAICVCHLEANYKNVNICSHRNSCKIFWKDTVSIYICLSKLVQIPSKCLTLTRTRRKRLNSHVFLNSRITVSQIIITRKKEFSEHPMTYENMLISIVLFFFLKTAYNLLSFLCSLRFTKLC